MAWKEGAGEDLLWEEEEAEWVSRESPPPPGHKSRPADSAGQPRDKQLAGPSPGLSIGGLGLVKEKQDFGV